MSKGNGHVPAPEFDFSEVSYGWAKQYSKVMARLAATGALIEEKAKNDITPEERAALKAARLEALAGWDELIEERDSLLVMPLVSVPREWLVKSAPEDIDWSDVKSLDWLRGDRLEALMTALNEARTDAQKK